MVHLYIGDGKGKTSAAVGLAVRSCGWGKKVYFMQFLKSRGPESGELAALKKLGVKVERLKNQVHPIFCKGAEMELSVARQSAEQGIKRAGALIDSGQYEVVILDEALNALYAGFLGRGELQGLIAKAKKIELVLTGREAPAVIISAADYVSRVKKIKHPLDKKVLARKGVEY